MFESVSRVLQQEKKGREEEKRALQTQLHECKKALALSQSTEQSLRAALDEEHEQHSNTTAQLTALETEYETVSQSIRVADEEEQARRVKAQVRVQFFQALQLLTLHAYRSTYRL
jgi:septal ring factor EnvC (AmiA/AmiB activator)